MKMLCPQTARFPDDLVGCGSPQVQWDENEGVFDCLDCGLWFTPAAADQNAGPGGQRGKKVGEQ